MSNTPSKAARDFEQGMADHEHGLRYLDDEGRCLACACIVLRDKLDAAQKRVEELDERCALFRSIDKAPNWTMPIDGELQDGRHPVIDFKRDSLGDIETKMRQRAALAIAKGGEYRSYPPHLGGRGRATPDDSALHEGVRAAIDNAARGSDFEQGMTDHEHGLRYLDDEGRCLACHLAGHDARLLIEGKPMGDLLAERDAEIKRLKAENAAHEVASRDAEIERKDEALRKIATWHTNVDDGWQLVDIFRRAALEALASR